MKINIFAKTKPELKLPNPLGSTNGSIETPSPTVQKTNEVAKQALSTPPQQDFTKQAEDLKKWMIANKQDPSKNLWIQEVEKRAQRPS